MRCLVTPLYPLEAAAVTANRHIYRRYLTIVTFSLIFNMAAIKGETLEDFAKKMNQVVNSGYICVAMTLGERMGLWKIMSELKEPKTCHEIAEISGLKENYLQQWLGAVVVGGIVDVDPSGKKFFLPPHRHPALLQGTPPCDNFANHASSVGLMFEYMKGTMKAMTKKPGETPTETKEEQKEEQSSKTDTEEDAYGEEMFHNLTNDFQDSHLFEHILPSNPKLIPDLDKGIGFLEVGCGTGLSSTRIAEKYPKSTVLGFEMSEDYLKQAKGRATEKNLTNVSFEIQNANELPQDWSEKFDHVLAINVIQHTTPAKSLAEVHRVLKPNGTLTLVTFHSHANVSDNVTLFQTSFVYVGNLCFMDEAYEESKEKDKASGRVKDEIVEPGWLWGQGNIINAVKLAGFKSCDIKEIPGTAFQITYICSK